jgi:tetratricopeptide (TPR) repeat protein
MHSSEEPFTLNNLRFWLERQRYDQVVSAASELLARDPDNPDLHRCLAIAWWMLNDSKKSQEHLLETIRLSPNDAGSHALLALLRSSQFGALSTDRHALTALALEPESLLAWHALGHSALVDDHETAKKCAKRMLTIDPDSVEARVLMYLAVRNEEGERWQSTAESWLADALRLDPNNAMLHGVLGNHLLQIRGREMEGEARLLTALSLEPSSPSAPDWRTAIASRRDPLLLLLNLPKSICLGILFWCARALSRWPILIILGKLFLVLTILCLMGLLAWLVCLWPIVVIYRSYVIHGDRLRTSVQTSRHRQFAILIPNADWLRRIIAIAAGCAWIAALPWLLQLSITIFPSLDLADLMGFGVLAILAGGVGLLMWMGIRKRLRRRALRPFT